MDTKQSLLRSLPAITDLLENEKIKKLKEEHPHQIVAESASEVVQLIREKILALKDSVPVVPDFSTIVELVSAKVMERSQTNLKKVINATGIVLHTNMGRAVLAEEAVRAITEIAGSYSNLELDLSTGERGTRYSHVEGLLRKLTGAEAGMIVNNNAAAVLLVLNTLANHKEVIVSRGQLVEIGGSFRIPDVMTQSGAILVEVGTTNKTHLKDYENAISEMTGLLLKVHTSNYKIVGFTSEVSASELVKLGKSKGLTVYDDLGSGVLVDFTNYGITHEHTVRESINMGVDIVTCSGDKLFGGPQAGIIVGKTEIINKIKKNPLTRALRVDKFTLAATEATLRLYLDEQKAVKEIPTLNMITMSHEEIRRKAKNLAELITNSANKVEIEIIEGFSQVGGGALPEENIPTYIVAVKPKEISVNKMEEQLRREEIPVLARIQKDRLLLDPRTLLAGDAEIIAAHIKKMTV